MIVGSHNYDNRVIELTILIVLRFNDFVGDEFTLTQKGEFLFTV